VRFLLNGKVEPGNIGNVQLCPALQATMSNLKRAHGGRRPALADYFLDDTLTEVVYRAQHNEEGGRFWRKSNANELHLTRQASRSNLR
jgi:oxidase EvaA